MKYGIDGYVYGKVTNITDAGNNQYDYTIFQEITKNTIIATLDMWDTTIGDEVELIHKDSEIDKRPICIARHNITKNIIEKIDATVYFPTEKIMSKTQEEWNEISLQKMHKLIGNTSWIQNVYDRYSYLIRTNSSTRGARNPFTPKVFTSTKLYIENARNIIFYYCIEKAKEGIREEYDKGLLNPTLFESFMHEYYLLFVQLIRDIPIGYQTIEEFENRFADLKQEIGL